METPFDTIAAIATPAGTGGIAVVRISGPKSLGIADLVFQGTERPSQVPSHTVHYGKIVDPQTGELLDEVLLTVFRAPRSYTAEDMVEISCHGSNIIADRLLQVSLLHGARLAVAGEFTRRAVKNKRIDLIQAEAVSDLVSAKTDTALKAALNQLSGNLSRNLNRLSESLKDCLSRCEAMLEFPEEEIVESEHALTERIRDLATEFESLLAQGEAGRFLREGASVVIVGKPNVGKSSIFNRLVTEERSIVTEIPGTTRDSIEASVNLGGVPLTLYDTCGLGKTTDQIEVLGAEKTKFYLGHADLVIALFDSSVPVTNEDFEVLAATRQMPRLLVLNKIDLPFHFDTGIFNGQKPIFVSAKYGTGIEDLNQKLQVAFAVDDTPVVTNRRHLDAIGRAHTALKQALANPYLEIRALEVKTALAAVGEITGATAPEEILDRIFATFCIGK